MWHFSASAKRLPLPMEMFLHYISEGYILASQTKRLKGTASAVEPACEQELQLLHSTKIGKPSFCQTRLSIVAGDLTDYM